jgi:hypothetical protein
MRAILIGTGMLAGLAAAVLGVVAASRLHERRAAARRADFDRHASEALATVQVEQCPAVVDRVPRRLPDPDRCPHLRAGSTAFGSLIVAGEPLQVCDQCWTAARLTQSRINGLMQYGIPQAWQR